MPSPGPILVKLGGSVLTDKRKANTFRPTAARATLAALVGVGPVVLLHGAGSFGHPQARRIKLGARRIPEKEAAGVARVQASVDTLRSKLLTLAGEVDLPVWSVPAHGVLRRVKGKLQGRLAPLVAAAVADGMVPVLSGCVVPDDRLGWSIASADELIAMLAHPLRASRVVLVTGAGGVFDRDPTKPGARLLSTADTKTVVHGTGQGADATGRMAGKLQWALTCAKAAPTSIVGPADLPAALQGRQVGTRILS